MPATATAPDRRTGRPADRASDAVAALRAVRAVPGTAAVLLTVRSGLEGGALDGGEDAYAALLDALLGSLADLPAADRPDALDVEIARPAAALIARAHALGLDAVASFLDFHGTPADDALRGRLTAMETAGADALKIAVTPRRRRRRRPSPARHRRGLDRPDRPRHHLVHGRPRAREPPDRRRLRLRPHLRHPRRPPLRARQPPIGLVREARRVHASSR